MEYRVIDHEELRRDLKNGMDKEMYENIKYLPIAPNWTVETYVSRMEAKGRIKEDKNSITLVDPEFWDIR